MPRQKPTKAPRKSSRNKLLTGMETTKAEGCQITSVSFQPFKQESCYMQAPLIVGGEVTITFWDFDFNADVRISIKVPYGDPHAAVENYLKKRFKVKI